MTFCCASGACAWCTERKAWLQHKLWSRRMSFFYGVGGTMAAVAMFDEEQAWPIDYRGAWGR